MKLWLLDADVVIKFLELGILNLLVGSHEVHVTPTVVEEVKYFYRDGEKVFVDIRQWTSRICTGIRQKIKAPKVAAQPRSFTAWKGWTLEAAYIDY